MRYVKKPGYMTRAVVAWLILNGIMIFTLAVVVWIIPREFLGHWFVMIPLLVGIVVSEWIIMAETVAPIIKDWIKQEMQVEDPKPPTPIR